eukprot:scaffold124036_cov66-Phaeocystis_antarctica.AAC.1
MSSRVVRIGLNGLNGFRKRSPPRGCCGCQSNTANTCSVFLPQTWPGVQVAPQLPDALSDAAWPTASLRPSADCG